MELQDRERAEIEAFDEAVSNEYGKIEDKELFLPEDLLKSHLNASSPPATSYRYAIYLLKNSEIKNQNVLNVACGSGEEAIILAKKGAKIFAFDISSASVKIAQKRAIVNNVPDRVNTEVMSVYNLKFADKTFKYVYGNACLHHFDLKKAIKEIYRILKPGGIAIFREPFSGSKVLRIIRDFIPIKKNVVSPYERQLTYNDIRLINKFFKTITVQEFGLFTRLARIIKNSKILAIIYKIDSFLLNSYPFLKKYAATVVIKVVK